MWRVLEIANDDLISVSSECANLNEARAIARVLKTKFNDSKFFWLCIEFNGKVHSGHFSDAMLEG